MRKKRANRILDQGQVLMFGLGLLCVLALLLLGFRCLAILVRHRRKNDRYSRK